MPESPLLKILKRDVRKLDRLCLSFGQRPLGNYTERQLSLAASYALFCHASIENFIENWATRLTDIADSNWASGRATRALVHLCTFHEGRNPLSSIPNNDIWSEVINLSIRKHRAAIRNNHGIKEHNIVSLISPLGFDVRSIDPILLADMSAFGGIRGGYAHQSVSVTVASYFDPFDVQTKAKKIITLVETLDAQLLSYEARCR